MNWVRTAWSRPSAILLAVQLLGILAYPAMGDKGIGRAAFNAFGIVVVLLALRAVRFSPGLTWVGITLALPAAVLLLAQVFAANTALGAASSALEAALYLYAVGCTLAYILADHDIGTDELWAVGSAFTLLAWAFAHMYVVCQWFDPAAFGATQKTWMELLFLSVTNLSATGLSDIVPLTGPSRAIVMLEQIVGLGYVAMLVGRVVGLTILSRKRG